MTMIDNDKEINQLIEFVCKRWEKYDVSEVGQLVRYIWENSFLSIKDISEVETTNQSKTSCRINIDPEVLKGVTKNFCSSLKMRPKNWNKLAKDYVIGKGIDEYEKTQMENDKEEFNGQKFNQFSFYKEVSLPYVMKKYAQSGTTPLIVLMDAINKQAFLINSNVLEKNQSNNIVAKRKVLI